MVSRYRGRGDKPGHRISETGHFLTIVSSSRWILPQQGQGWRPPTDVYETDDSIVVKVEVAGMAEDDFAITLADRTLIVAGIRRDLSAKRGYQQMEIPYGEFRTDIHLSEAIAADSVEASYKDGFLLVTLPKARPHTVSNSHE